MRLATWNTNVKHMFVAWSREHGKCYSDVKNQGAECGSCWLHAALSAVEAALSILYDIPATAISPFARQQILDCANYEVLGGTYLGDNGCNEGTYRTYILHIRPVLLP